MHVRRLRFDFQTTFLKSLVLAACCAYILVNEQLREILRMAPKQRQTLLFSATFNDDVAGLVALSLKQPVRLAADAAAAAPSTLSQEVGLRLFVFCCFEASVHHCMETLELQGHVRVCLLIKRVQ
jgi:hypothetical protein